MPEVLVESVIDVFRLLNSNKFISLFGLRVHVCQYEFTTFEHAIYVGVPQPRAVAAVYHGRSPRELQGHLPCDHASVHFAFAGTGARAQVLRASSQALKFEGLLRNALFCFLTVVFFLGFSLLASGQWGQRFTVERMATSLVP